MLLPRKDATSREQWLNDNFFICGDGSKPISINFNGMNIHLPAILMWTTGLQGFDPFLYVSFQNYGYGSKTSCTLDLCSSRKTCRSCRWSTRDRSLCLSDRRDLVRKLAGVQQLCVKKLHDCWVYYNNNGIYIYIPVLLGQDLPWEIK